ncbi:ExbD/TolR family protein [Luteolibacter soli]|uniref:Biopolymer transporter ExbD n=1 Tax=Luteolibacter soli TaxID=3135280 RepID=A0ABU9B0Y5_9BACT
MIDVVFVIMLFFMVMAGQQQVENELNLKLPGSIPGTPIAIEETQVHIMETGDVLLNDDPVGEPGDAGLKNLAATMVRLAESSKATDTKVVVSIMADEMAPYQRVIDVLNALAVARIENVTFEVPPQ